MCRVGSKSATLVGSDAADARSGDAYRRVDRNRFEHRVGREVLDVQLREADFLQFAVAAARQRVAVVYELPDGVDEQLENVEHQVELGGADLLEEDELATRFEDTSDLAKTFQFVLDRRECQRRDDDVIAGRFQVVHVLQIGHLEIDCDVRKVFGDLLDGALVGGARAETRDLGFRRVVGEVAAGRPADLEGSERLVAETLLQNGHRVGEQEVLAVAHPVVQYHLYFVHLVNPISLRVAGTERSFDDRDDEVYRKIEDRQ